MSDATIALLITSVSGFLGVAISGVIAYYLAKLKQIGDSTHRLVNSGDLAQKQQYAAQMLRLAKLTKDPADMEEANRAQTVYLAHKEAQDKEAQAKANGTKILLK